MDTNPNRKCPYEYWILEKINFIRPPVQKLTATFAAFFPFFLH